MKKFIYNSEKFDLSVKEKIIDFANSKEIFVKTNLGTFPAKIAGSNLEFPYIYDNLHIGISSEISWKLAQRIAKGQINTIEI